MHNGAFCKPKLLRSLTEAVLLAAVEGPQKDYPASRCDVCIH